MISIGKFLKSATETEQALMRVVQLLLQGIALHAVEGPPEDFANFRNSIQNIANALQHDFEMADLLVHAGSALRSLEDYNKRAARYLRSPGADLQAMVKMLADAVAAMSSASEENIRRLREIEVQVVSATQAEDVRLIRVKLSECLAEIRKESERQRTETARATEQFTQDIQRFRAEMAAQPLDDKDAVTGLPGRTLAEEALSRACQSETPVYVAVMVLDRLQTFNTRFGCTVGDEVLRYFAGFLRRQLRPADQIFRWTGPIMIGLLARPQRLEIVREEVARLMDYKYEHTVRTAARTILLPVSARWTVFPAMASPRLLGQKIETFATGHPVRD